MRGAKDRLARSLGAKRVLTVAITVCAASDSALRATLTLQSPLAAQADGDGAPEHMLTRYLLQLTGKEGGREEGPGEDGVESGAS